MDHQRKTFPTQTNLYRKDSYSKPTKNERDTIEKEKKASENKNKIAFKKEQEVAAELLDSKRKSLISTCRYS